jgi:Transposase IS66 family
MCPSILCVLLFYVSFYRLEDIFARQGFEISWATQSIWCGDVADLVEPLYELMAEKVRAEQLRKTLHRTHRWANLYTAPLHSQPGDSRGHPQRRLCREHV